MITTTSSKISVIGKVLLHAFLLLVLVITFLPFYWMILSSLRLTGDIFSGRASFLPARLTWENYPSLLRDTGFLRWAVNSLIISVGATGLGVLLSSLAGFAFAKYEFRGKNQLFALILGSVAIPSLVTLIPVFILMTKLGWINTYRALILPASVNAFGVFFMRRFIAGIPDELLDAGRIDGCSEFQLYHKILFPLMRPGLGALGIFLFLGNWQEYLWPLILTMSRKMSTLPLGIATLYANQFQIDYGVIMAGAFLATVPIIVLFIFVQNQFVAGLTQGMGK